MPPDHWLLKVGDFFSEHPGCMWVAFVLLVLSGIVGMSFKMWPRGWIARQVDAVFSRLPASVQIMAHMGCGVVAFLFVALAIWLEVDGIGVIQGPVSCFTLAGLVIVGVCLILSSFMEIFD